MQYFGKSSILFIWNTKRCLFNINPKSAHVKNVKDIFKTICIIHAKIVRVKTWICFFLLKFLARFFFFLFRIKIQLYQWASKVKKKKKREWLFTEEKCELYSKLKLGICDLEKEKGKREKKGREKKCICFLFVCFSFFSSSTNIGAFYH